MTIKNLNVSELVNQAHGLSKTHRGLTQRMDQPVDTDVFDEIMEDTIQNYQTEKPEKEETENKDNQENDEKEVNAKVDQSENKTRQTKETKDEEVVDEELITIANQENQEVVYKADDFLSQMQIDNQNNQEELDLKEEVLITMDEENTNTEEDFLKEEIVVETKQLKINEPEKTQKYVFEEEVSDEEIKSDLTTELDDLKSTRQEKEFVRDEFLESIFNKNLVKRDSVTDFLKDLDPKILPLRNEDSLPDPIRQNGENSQNLNKIETPANQVATLLQSQNQNQNGKQNFNEENLDQRLLNAARITTNNRTYQPKALASSQSLLRQPTYQALKSQVNNLLRTVIHAEKDEAEIRLNPPEWGKVKVHVEIKNEKYHVSMIVENPAVRDILNQELNELKKLFEDNNLELEFADVNLGSQNLNEGGSNSKAFVNHRQQLDESFRAEDQETKNETIQSQIRFKDPKASVVDHTV